MCQPEDVGLSLGDFAAATTPNTIERDTPNRIALDLSDMELRREMEARGVFPNVATFTALIVACGAVGDTRGHEGAN